MEAISARYICGNYGSFSIDCTKHKEYYPKPEADAEIARLEHQIKVLNADLTRCQDSKAKFGDKILRLQASVENILFKHRQGVPLEAVDFEWLERAVGEKA